MEDFASLFRANTPLLDVRAPVEFHKGAFPYAVNIPILDDEQRRLVGICYKDQGAAAAEALGQELVGPLKDARVAAWQHFIEANPDARLYCFRGGKRSEIATRWLAEAGVRIQRITGGYKAMRQFLLDSFDRLPEITLISGKTGVGKTEMLIRYDNAVDLEGLARHRGSAFGKTLEPQPAQIDFENSTAIKILQQPGGILLEDESRLIGRVSLPVPLQQAMARAPIILLDDTLEGRVDRIVKEYVTEPLMELDAESGIEQLERDFLQSVDAIKKRLGGERHRQVSSDMKEAFRRHRGGDVEGHRAWIEALLVDYYDPMYEYQLSKKAERIELRVDWSSIPAGATLNLGSNSCELL